MGKITAAVGLAVTQLRHERTRTLLAVCGVTIAVLAVTLLAGSGLGVLAVGQEQFDAADRDLWITGGPLGLSAAGGGSIDTTITDGHTVADSIAEHEDVRVAAPMAFQTVYISPDPETEYETVLGVGYTGQNSAIQLSDGDGFSGPSPHYAGGTYDGPMQHEVVLDPRTADALGVSVNDTVYMGGTLSAADENEFTVVGISSTFTGFLATPTASTHLSELQTVTGTTGTDSVTMIIVELEDGGDPEAVQADLQADYPNLEVRTNRDQLEATVGQQATVIAGASLLVGVAIIAGAMLTIDLLLLFVSQHRRELATLSAIGVSSRTVTALVVSQGLILGTLGWLVGSVLTVPAVWVLNKLAGRLVGYEGLVIVDPLVFAAGGVVAIGIGGVASLVAAWRLPSGEPMSAL